MTREYREYVKSRIEYLLKISSFVFDERDREALEVAIQALSQEPCDDVVSRESVLKKIDYEVEHYCKYLEEVEDKRNAQTHVALVSDNIREEVEQLPPVMQKSGKWILLDLANAIESDDSGYWTNKRISSALRNISSVTQKSGVWVEIDDEPHEVWECNHCGFVIDGSGCIEPYEYRDTYKFCPNCGAKMQESEEV